MTTGKRQVSDDGRKEDRIGRLLQDWCFV